MVARELRRLSPRTRLGGVGGMRMARAGVAIESSMFSTGVMGWTGALARIPASLSLLRRLNRRWRSRPPSAVLLIDNPGFNLRLARVAVSRGIPAYYYVCPQVWAWGAQRLVTMRRLLRKVFLVLPFEEPLYQAFGIRAQFVGHPLLELLRKEAGAARLSRSRIPRILMLPGSRHDEIARHLPVFLEAARLMAASGSRLDLRVATTTETASQVRSLLTRAPELGVSVAVDPGYAWRAGADLAWTTSGTATLETGLLGVPQVIVYRMNWINWLIVSSISRVRCAGLVNLLVGRRAAPELLQSDFTAPQLVRATRKLLRAPARRVAKALGKELVRLLAGSGASRTVARDLLAAVEGGGR